MLKVGLLVWIVLGVVLAGAGVAVIVSIPSLFDQGLKLIPVAGVVGYILAIPLSWVIARRIVEATSKKA